MIVKRVIKDQEQEYEYKGKTVNYNTNMNIRINKDIIGKLKSLSWYLGYKDYAKLVRDIIDDYLEKYEFIEDTSLVDQNNKYIIRENR